MTYTFTANAPAQPVPGQFVTQKFGRIEAVRSTASGTEIDIRQPDGCLLTALLNDGCIDTGTSDIQIGRNIWVSGHLDGAAMTTSTYMVYAEEL